MVALDLLNLIARQILAARVPHHLGDRRSAVRSCVEDLKLGAVAQKKAAKPMKFAELLHLSGGERHQRVDGKIELRAANHRLAVGGDLEDHELVADPGADDLEPVRFAEIEKPRPARSDVLERRRRLDVDRRGERQRSGLDGRSRRRTGCRQPARRARTAAARVHVAGAGERRRGQRDETHRKQKKSEHRRKPPYRSETDARRPPREDEFSDQPKDRNSGKSSP